LIISNLYLRFSKKLLGIKGLNLLIEKGTVFGLLGMNGSGKSTTIKLVLNDLPKTFGNIYFGDR
jgi:ABC-type multidrug transport system ATPase subunit